MSEWTTRAELPPVPGFANKRELEEILRCGRGRWYATYCDGDPCDLFDA